jgi:hypothetical protein
MHYHKYKLTDTEKGLPDIEPEQKYSKLIDQEHTIMQAI